MPLVQQEGPLVVVGGALAVSPQCCCPCCCLDGAPAPEHRTQASCEAAGGAWVPVEYCNTGKCRCYCADYRFLCYERVWSYYSFTWNSTTSAGGSTPDTIPAGQPPGTLLVWGGGVPVCAGTAGEPQDHQNASGTFCFIDDPCAPTFGMTAYRPQWYWRLRVVDDCEDCGGPPLTYAFADPNEPYGCDGFDITGLGCAEGVEAISCTPISSENCLPSSYLACAESLNIDLCVNVFP